MMQIYSTAIMLVHVGDEESPDCCRSKRLRSRLMDPEVRAAQNLLDSNDGGDENHSNNGKSINLLREITGNSENSHSTLFANTIHINQNS
jgi:hypothetical protein